MTGGCLQAKKKKKPRYDLSPAFSRPFQCSPGEIRTSDHLVYCIKTQLNLVGLYNFNIVSRLYVQLMLVSVDVYQGWPGYDLMWRWGTLSPPAAREGAALSKLPLTGGRSRLHAGLSRATDRWSDGSIKPFRDGPRDRGCWESSQSPAGPCSCSLVPGQMEWYRP